MIQQMLGPIPANGSKLYWRLKQDVKDGSLAWIAGWKIGNPASGLIEIGNTPTALSGVVMSVEEIEVRFAS